MRDHGGMNDCVQFLHPRRRTARAAERGFGQPGSADASVGIKNFAPEAPDDFLIDRVARFHERMRDRIGLNQVRAAADEHFANDGLAARNAASEAEV
jgi:hypothetical protein